MANIFDSIKDRVLHIADIKNVGRRDFCEKIGMTYQNFTGKAKLTPLNSNAIENIFAIHPDISLEWLLTGKGSMLKEAVAPVCVAKEVLGTGGIPLIPITGFAGFGSETFEDLQIEHYYDVPEFKQADFLMRIKGNSMYPKYSSGDIIACAIVNEMLFFQWNKIYAIYTNSQGVLVKRVKPSKIKESILLVSDNDKYDPFDIPISEIVRIALVIGVIRLE